MGLYLYIFNTKWNHNHPWEIKIGYHYLASRLMASQSCPKPQNLWICYITLQRIKTEDWIVWLLADLNIGKLFWVIPVCPVYHRGPDMCKREADESLTEWMEREKGLNSHCWLESSKKTRVACRSWKKQINKFSLEVLRKEHGATDILILVHLPNCKIIDLYCFTPLSMW